MPVEYAPRGLIGVLTPQANTTVEPEFSILWPAGIAMINARMVSPKATIEERLVDYLNDLDRSIAQFGNAPLDAIALATTGASYLVGIDGERDLVARLEQRRGVPFVTAGRAVVAALQALAARRIGLVSPYPPALTERSVAYWTANGLSVDAVVPVAGDGASFHPIYSIGAAGARTALGTLAGRKLEAIVMLGTGMPTLEPILDVPSVDGAPVLSCMLALAWAAVAAATREPASADSVLAWVRAADWGPRLRARRWPARAAG
jgi:maleate isomerase